MQSRPSAKPNKYDYQIFLSLNTVFCWKQAQLSCTSFLHLSSAFSLGSRIRFSLLATHTDKTVRELLEDKVLKLTLWSPARWWKMSPGSCSLYSVAQTILYAVISGSWVKAWFLQIQFQTFILLKFFWCLLDIAISRIF